VYERKLINQTAKLTAIFDSSHHYIWTIDRQERLTSFNKNYFDIISSLYNTKPYLGLVLNRGILSHDNDYNKLLKHHYKIAFEGMASTFEVEIWDKNNKKVNLEVFLNPIFEKDKVIEVSGIAHNITEKKQAQQKIEASLKEKEVLLREVHHRVKNNMQVVSSILNLQSSYVSDEYALALLKESQNRIKTMAIIHESLYQNKSFSSVNFSEYVRTLISNIIHSYSSSKEKVKVELNIADVILPLDSSIPAGLILNELVTNAIKHAFPGTRHGVITVDLKCEENLVFLELKDNGVGFKENVSFQNSHSLGLQLVNTLIEQIDGKYEFKSEKDIGTEIKVTFKM
jgi:PAS domain S-box-containing protein